MYSINASPMMLARLVSSLQQEFRNPNNPCCDGHTICQKPGALSISDRLEGKDLSLNLEASDGKGGRVEGDLWWKVRDY